MWELGKDHLNFLLKVVLFEKFYFKFYFFIQTHCCMSPTYGAHKPKEKTFPNLFNRQSTAAPFPGSFPSPSPRPSPAVTDSFSSTKALPIGIIFGVAGILKKVSKKNQHIFLSNWGPPGLRRGDTRWGGREIQILCPSSSWSATLSSSSSGIPER